MGYQIDSTVAEQLSLVAGSQIALTTGHKMIASTLSPADQAGFKRWIQTIALARKPNPQKCRSVTINIRWRRC